MAKNQTKAKGNPDSAFSIDSKLLIKAIDQVLAIVPAGAASVYRLEVDETIRLAARQDDTYARVTIEGTINKKKMIYFIDDNLLQMKTMVRNRGVIDFIIDGPDLKFKSGRYSASLRLTDPEDISSSSESRFNSMSEIKFNKKQLLSMKDGFFSLINSAVAATRIVNSFFDGYISTALIQYYKGVLQVVTFDEWHIHHFSAKVKSDTPDLRITIPTAIFGTLEKVIKGEATQMYIDSTMFVLQTDSMIIVLPPMQELEADAYIELMNNLPKPVTSFKTDSSLGSALDNISGLIKKEGATQMEFTLKDKVGTVSYSNPSGSIRDKFKAKDFKGKEMQIQLDYAIFSDTFRAMKNAPEFEFRVHQNEEGIPSIYSMKGDILNGTLNILGYVS